MYKSWRICQPLAFKNTKKHALNQKMYLLKYVLMHVIVLKNTYDLIHWVSFEEFKVNQIKIFNQIKNISLYKDFILMNEKKNKNQRSKFFRVWIETKNKCSKTRFWKS